MYNIQQLRQTEFPLSEDILYFNHASISPLPTRTKNKVMWSAQRLSEHPTRHFMQDGLPVFQNFGAQLAAHINAADPREIVLVSSTSAGINAFAQAFPWEAGDNVAFCEVEFPSNAYPWMSLERDGVEARQVPAIDGGLTLEALEPKVDDRTRIVAASALQFFNGHRTDLQQIGDFCHQRGIVFVVDAIQAAGHIPMDVQGMHIDVLAAGGQKSLLAPPGVGFMYVRNAIADMCQPRSIGPNATKDWLFWLEYDLTFEDGAARFSAGTPNVAGLFGLLESVGLLAELELTNIDLHTTSLAAETIEVIANLGYEPITPREEHGSIVTFKSGLDAEQNQTLIQYLDAANVSVTQHFDVKRVPHVRLSFHCYNTKEEIHQFEAIMKEFSV